MEIFTTETPINVAICGDVLILEQYHRGCEERHFIQFNKVFLDILVEAMKAAIAPETI